MPPLRQRITDLPLLVAHFLDLLNQKYRRTRRLTPDAMALLSDYVWPGNIRELRNVLERVYVETVGEVIGRKAFDEWVEEREQFSPGAWNVEARQTSLAERPALITPYPGAGAYRVVPPAFAGGARDPAYYRSRSYSVYISREPNADTSDTTGGHATSRPAGIHARAPGAGVSTCRRKSHQSGAPLRGASRHVVPPYAGPGFNARRPGSKPDHDSKARE